MTAIRRRFLRYAGTAAVVIAASAVGLELFSTRRGDQIKSTTSATSVNQFALISTTQLSLPSSRTHLLASANDFQQIWQLVQTDRVAASYYSQIKADADSGGRPASLRVHYQVLVGRVGFCMRKGNDGDGFSATSWMALSRAVSAFK